MKCSDLQDSLAVYADGLLTDDENIRVKDHLDTCPLCRERHDEYREIASSLRRLGKADLAPAARRSIKQNVISEARRHRRSWLSFAPDVREFLQMRVLPYGIGSFAAVIICGGFLALMFSGALRNGSTLTAKEPMLLASNRNPLLKEGDVSPIDLVQSRLGFASESPSINPQGALVALTNSFMNTGMKGNDEVVVVADVYSDGLAQIAEVVEPRRNTRIVGQLEKALDSSKDGTPFVPSSMEARPASVRVVLKFRSVDVYARSKRSRG